MSSKYEFKSQVSFTPFSEDILPRGFRYPESYLAHAAAMDYPRHFLWWFNDSSSGRDLDWDFRLHWRSEGWSALADIDPIPFARNGDFAAYFDGNDHSGDPKVVVVDLGNKVYGREYANFDAWLDQAFRDSGMK